MNLKSRKLKRIIFGLIALSYYIHLEWMFFTGLHTHGSWTYEIWVMPLCYLWSSISLVALVTLLVSIAVDKKNKGVKMEEVKMEDLNCEELIREINGVIGAVDGKTLERVKMLVKYLRVYQWAYDQLREAIEISDREEMFKRKYEVREKLLKSIATFDKEIQESSG